MAEGSALCLPLRLPWRRSVALMVAANYASMFCGMLLVNTVFVPLTRELLGPVPLYGLGRALVALLAITFAVTVLAEWPFCRLALMPRTPSWRWALLASLLVQSLTYGPLVKFYYDSADLSLLNDVRAEPSLAFARGQRFWVYYLGLGDGTIYRVRPDGSQRQKMATVQDDAADAYLVSEAGARPGLVNLRVRHAGSKEAPRLVAAGVPGYRGNWETGHWASYGEDLTGSKGRYPRVVTHPYSWGGLELRTPNGERLLCLGVETPLLAWCSRRAFLLPGDLVVYQLSDAADIGPAPPSVGDAGSQIVVLDVRRRELGVLALGRGPVVVLDAPPLSAATSAGARGRRGVTSVTSPTVRSAQWIAAAAGEPSTRGGTGTPW